ncbi:MAG TPA: hypothetical protein VJL29_00745 [Thermoguttaceae bacterium]|nr:hypothetical protein [Thermoguttaceae bacterium]
MKRFAKSISILAVLFLLAGTAMGSEALATGTIKGVDADAKTFILTDSTGRDVTFTFGDMVVVNRGGTESKGDLKTGDAVHVSYDKGLMTSTAKYILVQEGDSKKWELTQGSFKSHDAATKEIVCTDAQGKDHTYALGDAKVRMNMKEAKVEDIKIGEQVLCIILEPEENKTTLQALMFERDEEPVGSMPRQSDRVVPEPSVKE